MDEIKLSPSAYQTIVTHALTHEKEEIIGLLFAEECEKHIQIYAAKPCPRITHLPDRVEMRDEDLASGIQEAEVSFVTTFLQLNTNSNGSNFNICISEASRITGKKYQSSWMVPFSSSHYSPSKFSRYCYAKVI